MLLTLIEQSTEQVINLIKYKWSCLLLSSISFFFFAKIYISQFIVFDHTVIIVLVKQLTIFLFRFIVLNINFFFVDKKGQTVQNWSLDQCQYLSDSFVDGI